MMYPFPPQGGYAYPGMPPFHAPPPHLMPMPQLHHLMTELANSTDYLIFFALETDHGNQEGGYRVMFCDQVRDQLIAMHRTQPSSQRPLTFDDQRMMASSGSVEFPSTTQIECIIYNARSHTVEDRKSIRIGGID